MTSCREARIPDKNVRSQTVADNFFHTNSEGLNVPEEESIRMLDEVSSWAAQTTARFLSLAIMMHFATTSTATSLFVSAFSAPKRGPRCLSGVGRFSTLTIPTVLASRTQPLESTLRELLDLEKLQLAYIGTAGTAPRKDSDRPLKDQRKKRRYEARYQCKMLGEIFSASSAQHIFLEDF